MLTRKRLAAALLSAAMAVAPVTVARADGYDPQPTCQSEPAPPECEIVAETPDKPGDDTTGGGTAGGGCARLGQPAPCYLPGRGWLGSNGCYYNAISPPGSYEMTCDLNGGGQATTVVQLPNPPIGAVVLGQRAVSLLKLPKPAMAASPGLDQPQLTLLPIWLWIDPVSWQQITATAAVPGVTVVATATPVRVTWNAGDGTPPLICAGPGAQYNPGSDPRAASSCSHAYARSSATQPGQAYTLTAQITWQITWTGAGLSGTVAPMTTTASVAVRVSEVQTVIIR